MICKNCKHLSSDSCRESVWYFCNYFSKDNEDDVDSNAVLASVDYQPNWCPLLKIQEGNVSHKKSIENNDIMSVCVKKLSKDATLPTKATDGSLGIDFYSDEDTIVPAKSFLIIGTGVAIEIVAIVGDISNTLTTKLLDYYKGTEQIYRLPILSIANIVDKLFNYGMILYDRSGLASKNNITRRAGVIDQDYRGEIKIVIVNESNEAYSISKGDKIAQGVITLTPKCNIVEVEQLSTTKRADGGFGHSGK